MEGPNLKHTNLMPSLSCRVLSTENHLLHIPSQMVRPSLQLNLLSVSFTTISLLMEVWIMTKQPGPFFNIAITRSPSQPSSNLAAPPVEGQCSCPSFPLSGTWGMGYICRGKGEGFHQAKQIHGRKIQQSCQSSASHNCWHWCYFAGSQQEMGSCWKNSRSSTVQTVPCQNI